jgi:hypothetical protein
MLGLLDTPTVAHGPMPPRDVARSRRRSVPGDRMARRGGSRGPSSTPLAATGEAAAVLADQFVSVGATGIGFGYSALAQAPEDFHMVIAEQTRRKHRARLPLIVETKSVAVVAAGRQKRCSFRPNRRPNPQRGRYRSRRGRSALSLRANRPDRVMTTHPLQSDAFEKGAMSPAIEREGSMVYPHVEYQGPAYAELLQAGSPTIVRELDGRTSDGLCVRLLWYPHDGRVSVAVDDAKTGDWFELIVRDGDRALEIFQHPDVHAALREEHAGDPFSTSTDPAITP